LERIVPESVESMSDKSKSSDAPIIVGIGASAGGLEAVQNLLGALAVHTGLSYVLVQHLDPNHESSMVEILRKSSPIAIENAVDKMRVKPDTLIVVPPNTTPAITDGTIQLEKREAGRHMPVDAFFRSLADAHGQNAIGIVLSGMGSDGALGVRALKDSGGITFAQDPQEAKFDGMPRNAMNTQCIDFTLPVKDIAQELKRLAGHPYVRPQADKPPSPTEEENQSLIRIFGLLKLASGVDFAHYKRSTLMRRIARRLLVHRLDSFKDYVALLQKNPLEVEALYQDILIKVTGFFRDPAVFDYLKTKIIPALISRRDPKQPLRIWVPGCSTGEEVYSIAICILETMAELMATLPVQVFATDISELAIGIAREGRYIENISQDVSPERLRRFFIKSDDGYQVCKQLREMCIFARQNMTSDPPFSKLDLISCRNVLIYLEPKLQKRVVPLFHYALKPSGMLLLGTSETVGQFSELFAIEEKRLKVFTRLESSGGRPRLDFDAKYTGGKVDMEKGNAEQPRPDPGPLSEARKEADRIVFSKFSAAGVVINSQFEIVQFRGGTNRFLEHGPGDPSFNLLRLARGGLGLEIRTLIHEARQKRAMQAKDNIIVVIDDESRFVRVEVHPLFAGSGEPFFLVLFQESENSKSPAEHAPPAAPADASRAELELEQLRRELNASKEHLQSIIEEQDATNEELQSANEEVLSSNEELQSINEELETAKEELQSTNEELTTVNEELQNRNMQLGTLNNDLTNLLGSVNIAILMLSSDLRIRRFTPQAERLFSLIPGDVGRSIGDIKPRIKLPDLEHLVAEVVESITVKELEVQDREGRWYSMRVRPYKTRDNKIDGAVIALVDIDMAKRGQMQWQNINVLAQHLVTMIQQPTLILDNALKAFVCNETFLKRFGMTRASSHDKLIDHLDGFKPLREPLEQLLAGEQQTADFQLPVQEKQPGGPLKVRANKVRFSSDINATQIIVLIVSE
jgi:two-component system CheB/CheR fusion protein